MRHYLRGEQTVRTRPRAELSHASRAGHRFRSAVETGVLAALLLAVVASVLIGSSAVLFCAVVGAWPVLALIVGPSRVLDAGCAFMLLVVGVILVVDLATNGSAAFLP